MCPACGYCPHCGRGGDHFSPYTYPYGPVWFSVPYNTTLPASGNTIATSGLGGNVTYTAN